MNFYYPFDTWHQWVLLRPLFVLLLVVSILFVGGIVGICRDLRKGRRAAGTSSQTTHAAERVAELDVVRFDESAAARAESKPRQWGRGGHPSDRHAV